jgi:sugar phosphate isomerase/epimerase
LTDSAKLEAASRAVRWVAAEADRIGCRASLYNHGGWFGEPANQIAIIERVGARNLGIVYNFHHGHAHIERFGELLERMLPHLTAVNLNGMRKEGPMILPIGEGDREQEMIRVLARSGYRGPVGILNHRTEIDAEAGLKQNLEGLRKVVRQLGR